MPRIYTRTKRKLKLGATSQKHRFWKGTTPKRVRPKSFASKELAEKYAEANKLDRKAHVLHETFSGKFQWRKSA